MLRWPFLATSYFSLLCRRDHNLSWHSGTVDEFSFDQPPLFRGQEISDSQWPATSNV